MPNTRLYQIVFDGSLTGKIAADQVRQNLAAMFKMNATQVEALFSGNSIVIKRNIDEATAKKYQLAFNKAGAICTLVASTAADTPTKPAAASTNAGGAVSRETGRLAGKDIVNKKIPTDLGGLSLGKPGDKIPTLTSRQDYELPDLSELSLAQDDGYLVEPEETPEPKVNIAGLKMEDID
jgi:hypothetical protein